MSRKVLLHVPTRPHAEQERRLQELATELNEVFPTTIVRSCEEVTLLAEQNDCLAVVVARDVNVAPCKFLWPPAIKLDRVARSGGMEELGFYRVAGESVKEICNALQQLINNSEE